MSQETWTGVDDYITDRLHPADPILDAAQADIVAAGLPAISVSPTQGKLLHVLARSVGARSILEIGTLGGYSTIWLARALPPHGRLVTLEAEPKHAQVAQKNLERAGLAGLVAIRLGRAIETLPQLAAEGLGPFDLVFVDADKESSTEYFNWSLKLTRPGSLIVVDNVIRQGEVANPNAGDPSVQGVQRLFDRMAGEPRVVATALQTVGSKGYDGMMLAVVLG